MDSDQNYQANKGSDSSSFGWYLIVAVLAVAVVAGAVVISAGENSDEAGGQSQQNTTAAENTDQAESSAQSASQPSVADQSDISVPIDQFPDGLIRAGDTVTETTSDDASGASIAYLESGDSLEDVFEYYSNWFDNQGLQVGKSSLADGLLVASNTSVDVAIEFSTSGADGTQVTINYLTQ